MDARTAILARIADALGRSQHEPAPDPPREYRTRADLAPGSAEVVGLLVDRLVDYRASVRECSEDDLGAVLAELLSDDASVVVPVSLPWTDAVTATGAEVRPDSRTSALPHADLAATDAVVTAARVAIAETGTIVLDGEPDQGRRAISLIPDHHVCVVRRDQVVGSVPEAIAVLGEAPARPMTWISGPSATSDIELVRVEGVHGPRRLDVVILG
ncbi:LutC/YkgG family protein [Georgenia wangjunii]|uniref:LutC/YkgG family protein n=1 Tax=Georgenia wangjunii TaxID=3117730 RepID=UPI002F26BD4C